MGVKDLSLVPMPGWKFSFLRFDPGTGVGSFRHKKVPWCCYNLPNSPTTKKQPFLLQKLLQKPNSAIIVA